MSKKILGIGAIVFGLITILEGGRTILFPEHAPPNVIMEVLWLNTVAGFFYLVAGFLVFKNNPKAYLWAKALAMFNVALLTYLLLEIQKGTPYETRTLAAMIIRTVFWLLMVIRFNPRFDRGAELT